MPRTSITRGTQPLPGPNLRPAFGTFESVAPSQLYNALAGFGQWLLLNVKPHGAARLPGADSVPVAF